MFAAHTDRLSAGIGLLKRDENAVRDVLTRLRKEVPTVSTPQSGEGDRYKSAEST